MHFTSECPHGHRIKRLNRRELESVSSLAKHNRCLALDCPSQTRTSSSSSSSSTATENWLCLTCHFVSCSERHVLDHSKETGHPIAASLSDNSVFCYECMDYIHVDEMVPVVDAIHAGRTLEYQIVSAILKLGDRVVKPVLVVWNWLWRLLRNEPKRVLRDSSIEAFAEYIRRNKCKKIVVLTGAGISTSAGIRDFRSPGTGIYDNLQSYNLPTSESVFDINYFRTNPKPFFQLAQEIFPGNFQPTKSHYFIKLLSNKNLLLRNFTQNIDTLESIAGINPSYIIESHGSFASASCIGHFRTSPETNNTQEWIPSCNRKFTQSWLKDRLFPNAEIPRCPDCNGLVKPDITFFGEPVPQKFRNHLADLSEADALIVMGCSLSVAPFDMLPGLVGERVPRLLVNRNAVGGFLVNDVAGRDAVYLGDCDEGCTLLAQLLGCEDEFSDLVGQ
ncbi:SIR2-domain-containing protein [Rhizoclosmatium globosum]|uniref:SIR2-domain-containing protein n=1 Tax=Rhizoclosmatium globosum TaxID=329046 RepID=A0A1Y2BWH3_9FUNG|nr:SIR2-domain-containing protein [Rhizoclosmatium globosum]|eukprot:ORY39109.1 SIR2-domain-containing protein [Rhizoclosmatium globosum]